MKNFLPALLLAAACFTATPAFADEVTVTLTGVEARGGHILTALQTKDEFMQPKGHIGVITAAPTKAGTVTVTLSNVPPDEYSLSVLHDANDDKQMAMAGGMPAEGWAMKNAGALRGAPTWDAVSFKVNGPVAITEAMIYPQR